MQAVLELAQAEIYKPLPELEPASPLYAERRSAG